MIIKELQVKLKNTEVFATEKINLVNHTIKRNNELFDQLKATNIEIVAWKKRYNRYIKLSHFHKHSKAIFFVSYTKNLV